MKVERGAYSIVCGAPAVDVEAVHAFLTRSYWAAGISRELVARAVAGSLCFSLYHADRQIGFARVVTDRATYGYLADVYVLECQRGRGLGRWLVATVLAHPELQGLRRMSLVTRDAHPLYTEFGFRPLAAPESHMEISRSGLYFAAEVVDGPDTDAPEPDAVDRGPLR
jgi:GNAT superfamily N-acetyltransferase